MKNGKRKKLLTAFIVIALMLASGASQQLDARTRGGENAAFIEMLRLNTLMDHGIEMVAEGSNIVIFSGQDIMPSLDEMTMEHGRKMIKEGKAVIEKVLKGPEMKAARKAGYKANPFLKYINSLGNAELAFASMAENLGAANRAIPANIKARHIRVMIDHTLVMAAQGSDLAITGQMGLATEDAYSIEHGRMMLFDSRTMLSMVKGKEALELRTKNSAMEQTMKAGIAAGKIIDLLNNMPGKNPASK